MLISYTQRFLFIHIGKAAGSSIQQALEKYARVPAVSILHRRLVLCGVLNRWGGLYQRVDFGLHVKARTVQRCLPAKVYAGLFKFAFVRNPWDALVSRYAYLLQQPGHHRHVQIKQMKDFEEYVTWEIRRGQQFQSQWVTDRRGRLIVDFIGRYENLHADFACVCRELGVVAVLPRVNASKHRDYREYYTPQTRALVAQHFQRDIEMFGYDFDGVRSDRS